MWMSFLALLLAAPFAGPPRCKGNPALVGQCFTIHGRLRAYNGNPTFRIWPIGTRRIIGVTGPKPGDQSLMPQDLACGFSCDVIADFEVCPFSESLPGVMQRVCIEGASQRIVSRKE
jgi:hypothetical protein